MNLESVLRRAIEEKNLPKPVRIEICSKENGHKKGKDCSAIIQLNIGPRKKNPDRQTCCSFLDFVYNSKAKRIDNVNLYLSPWLRGKGYGKKLIEVMETVGRKMGCAYVEIDLNINPPFWENIGYRRKGHLWEKQLK